MKLLEDQQKAFKLIESETLPIFVTGAAGTGKSQLLRHLRDHGKDSDKTEVVAFTGAAAVNVDGRTIHSLVLNSKAWAQGIQVYVPLRDDREIKKSALEELAQLKLLIIDEISMVRADMIDALDRAFRLAKGNQKPFGGVRLVMFGDLRQLPPFVVDYQLVNRERRFLYGYESSATPYFFMAHVFTLTPIVQIELTIQKRVVGDGSQPFIDALNGLRSFPPDSDSVDFVNLNSQQDPDEDATFLFSERKPAAKHNFVKLHSLPGKSKTYKARFRRFDQEEFDEEAAEKVGDDFPAPKKLELRLGARVMVVANLDVQQGLVNGATGTVKEMLDQGVLVTLDRSNRDFLLQPHSFDWKGLALDSDVVRGEEQSQSNGLRKTRIIGSYLQVPLMLAWGVTIHKAQGATLDAAAIDFDSQYHSAGQAYVAVSRLTSIGGLSKRGSLGAWHFAPYSRYLDTFEQSAIPKPKTKTSFEIAAKKAVPWRNVEEMESLLDNYLELIPQVRDFFGFSHRRRMQYLREEKLMVPSAYLRLLYERDSENALYLYRNLDRALRNKPLVYSVEILGNEFEAQLRDKYEITVSDQRRLEFWCGSDWRAEAKKGVGQGKDVPTDVIPEYEITSIEFKSPLASWQVSRAPNPASKERFWEYRDPSVVDSKQNPQYRSLATLLGEVREDWDGVRGLVVNVIGDLEPARLERFLPYLGVNKVSCQILLNGDVVSFNSNEISNPVEVAIETQPAPYYSPDYPEQRFGRGEQVLLSIGAYAGKKGVILQIRELDYVQYLTVQPEGMPDPITIRGNYARRIQGAN